MNRIPANLSFLNIQYAWSDKARLVLFVPIDQYNQENIEKFNELKPDNCFLAIAKDGAETYKCRARDFNLSLYQHGYYDLLLNSDYNIIPCATKYYEKELPRKFTLEEFKQSFVFNAGRLKIYNAFVKIMSIVERVIDVTGVMVGGSFIERKENPNDLDFVISIPEKEFERIKNSEKLSKKYQFLRDSYKMHLSGYDLHAHVLAVQDVNLKKCTFDSQDPYSEYLCQRGYWLSLFGHKTIYNEDGHECYIRNWVNITK